MKYSFNCYGHENITAKHKTTLEFTKDRDLSLKGDCIIGVNADFSLPLLKKFIKGRIEDKPTNKKITITIKTVQKNKISEKIEAEIAPDFNNSNEIVIRTTDFVSERTFAIKADKAAFQLSRGLISFLKKKKNKIKVIFESG